MAEDANGCFRILGAPDFSEETALFIFDPLTKKVTSFKGKTGYAPALLVNFIQNMNDSILLFGNKFDNFFFT